MDESPFLQFMRHIAHKKTYLETYPYGNNGDVLVMMGTRDLLKKAGCKVVDTCELAEQILMSGGGRFQDVFPRRVFDWIAYYRREYPSLPLIMAPQVFRVGNINFREICEISRAPFILFARDHISAKSLREANLPAHCRVHLSHDPAFELRDSEFITNLKQKSSEKHVLIAMRKDEPMRKDELVTAKLLARAKGTWLPKKIRRPLSWIRDRIVAHLSRDIIKTILEQEKVTKQLPRIYRDVSVSVGYEEFVAVIRDAALIITNRLHVAVFGHLLGKRVVIVCAPEYVGQKLKGVYEFSMCGSNSRTSLYMANGSA